MLIFPFSNQKQKVISKFRYWIHVNNMTGMQDKEMSTIQSMCSKCTLSDKQRDTDRSNMHRKHMAVYRVERVKPRFSLFSFYF